MANKDFDWMSLPGAEIVEDNSSPVQDFDWMLLPGAEVIDDSSINNKYNPEQETLTEYYTRRINDNEPRKNFFSPSEDSSVKYEGQNPIAAYGKNLFAGAAGGVPDLVVGAHNLASKNENQWPSITEKISNFIDNATGGYTKDTGSKAKYSARFLGSLFGTGFTGKALQAAGAAQKFGSASNALEKTGKFVKNNLGVTNPSPSNIAAGAIAGAGVGFSEDFNLPAYAEIPLVIGLYMLGGGAGSAGQKILEPMLEKIPGGKQFINNQNYKELASKIEPDSIQDLFKTAIVDKEIDFLTQKTLSSLPENIQAKLKDNPALLNDQEIELVIDKGLKDFNSNIDRIEKENNISFTLGEKTGSPKIIAQEDYLANLPNIDKFDKTMKNRKQKIVQKIEQIKDNLSKNQVNSQSIGDKTATEVKNIYNDLKEIRRNQWDKDFGNVVDQDIMPIRNYINKLIEYSRLPLDNQGNEVAVKVANKRLASLGIKPRQYDSFLKDEELTRISPRRINTILHGLNEDIMMYPKETFSRSKMGKLKASLDLDVSSAENYNFTKNQAQIIKKARENYKTNSELIDKLDDSIIFSKINRETLEVPEKIAASLKDMPKSQLELTFDALKRSPKYSEVIGDVQKYYIDNALQAAMKNGSDSFNPRIFLDNLPKKPEFDIIFQDKKAYQQIKDISVGLKRISKFQPMRYNSKTAQRLQADEDALGDNVKIVKELTKGKFSVLWDKIKNVAKNSYNQRIADIMLSPKERDEVLKLVGKETEKNNTVSNISRSISNTISMN